MSAVADLLRISAARQLCADGGLRLLREHRGLSTYELAAAVGEQAGRKVAESTVSRWERGLRLPTRANALALMKVTESLATAEGV